MSADPELSRLIADVIDAGLLMPGSREMDVARRVASGGQRSLSIEDRRVWESGVLPILAQPIDIQIAVRTLARRSHRLPRRAVA